MLVLEKKNFILFLIFIFIFILIHFLFWKLGLGFSVLSHDHMSQWKIVEGFERNIVIYD